MNYKIPLFDLNYDQHEHDAVIDILRSKWISMGDNVANNLNIENSVYYINYTCSKKHKKI